MDVNHAYKAPKGFPACRRDDNLTQKFESAGVTRNLPRPTIEGETP
jgi:hypothetical protein